MPLTDAKVKNAKAIGKQYKIYDSDGLFLLVTTNGHKGWRLKYFFGGKEKLLSLGKYPIVSLKEARFKRNDIKKLLSQGIDPSAQRKALMVSSRALPDTFDVIAHEWFDKHCSTLAEKTKKQRHSLLEKDILPILGAMPITTIEAKDIITAIHRVEDFGLLHKSHLLLQVCSQIFRYAIATGRATYDTTYGLQPALKKPKSGHFATLTDKKRISELLRAIDAYDNGFYPTRCALRLAPILFVRPNELVAAEWNEFRLDTAEWRIPANRMKMKREHIVPLSRQAITILQELQLYTGNGKFLFPSPRNSNSHITESSLLVALRILNFTKEEMCIHGFRSMASTILNEKGYNRDWIERQLAHVDKDRIRDAYNHFDFLPERKIMMQEYSDYLDELRLEYI